MPHNMENNFTTLVCPCLLKALILIASAICAFGQSQMDNQQLAVQISTATESYASGAEIDINLEVTNHSDHQIWIPTGRLAPERGDFFSL
jgi:hypothetical protein